MKEKNEGLDQKKIKKEQLREWEPKLDKKTNKIKCWMIKLKEKKTTKKDKKTTIKRMRSIYIKQIKWKRMELKKSFKKTN